MVEGAAGEPDLRGEIVHRRGGKTRCCERLSRCPDQLGAVFLHRFGATLCRHSNLLIRIRCVYGVDGSVLSVLSHTQRMLLPRLRWNVQQSRSGAFASNMKRTMIWPSVKQCFPPTGMPSTRSTDIPPLCDRATCCSCRVRSAAAPMVRPNPISKLRFAEPSPIWKPRCSPGGAGSMISSMSRRFIPTPRSSSARPGP